MVCIGSSGATKNEFTRAGNFGCNYMLKELFIISLALLFLIPFNFSLFEMVIRYRIAFLSSSPLLLIFPIRLVNAKIWFYLLSIISFNDYIFISQNLQDISEQIASDIVIKLRSTLNETFSGISEFIKSMVMARKEIDISVSIR